MSEFDIQNFHGAFDFGDYDLALKIIKYILMHENPHPGTLSCLKIGDVLAGKVYRDSLLKTNPTNPYVLINMIDFLLINNFSSVAFDLCTESLMGKFSSDKNYVQFVLRRLHAATKSGRYQFALQDLITLVDRNVGLVAEKNHKYARRAMGFIVAINDSNCTDFLESILMSDVLDPAIKEIARHKLCEIDLYINEFSKQQ